MSRPVLFTYGSAASFFSFSLPDCYLLANLCQFTGTTFSWTATGGMTGFPRTDKRVAIPSFHLLKWLNGVALNDTTCVRNVFKICHANQKPKGGHIKQTGDIKVFHRSDNSGLLQHDTVQRVGLTYPDVSRKSHDFSFQGGVLDQLPFYNSPSLAYEDVRFSETPVTRPNTPHDQKLQHQRYWKLKSGHFNISFEEGK